MPQEQLTLWEEEAAPGPEKTKAQKRFDKFHAKHPEVYSTVLHVSQLRRAQGIRRYAIAAIFEDARHHLHMQRNGATFPRLNNNYKSRYARLIVEQEEGFEGFFELRKMKS